MKAVILYIILILTLSRASDLPPNWSRHVFQGQVYYFNQETKQSSWEKPLSNKNIPTQPKYSSKPDQNQKNVKPQTFPNNNPNFQNKPNDRSFQTFIQNPNSNRDKLEINNLQSEIKRLVGEISITKAENLIIINQTSENTKIIEKLNDQLAQAQEECWHLQEDVKALEDDLNALSEYTDTLKKNESSLVDRLKLSLKRIAEQDKILSSMNATSKFQKTSKLLDRLKSTIFSRVLDKNLTTTMLSTKKPTIIKKKNKTANLKTSKLVTESSSQNISEILMRLSKKENIINELNDEIFTLQTAIKTKDLNLKSVQSDNENLIDLKEKLQTELMERTNESKLYIDHISDLEMSLNSLEQVFESFQSESNFKYDQLERLTTDTIENINIAYMQLQNESIVQINEIEMTRDYYKQLYEKQCELYLNCSEEKVHLANQIKELKIHLTNCTAILSQYSNKPKIPPILKWLFFGVTTIVAAIIGRAG